ncbi:MAG TPA: ornithine cyclodeaminase family protein [Acetobacteraceae bacterium]|nr:ornithine cyclodeaminase family protein [Acetobacteraceae bacterium]
MKTFKPLTPLFNQNNQPLTRLAPMQVIDRSGVRAGLPWDRLVARLREVFAEGCVLPLRTAHSIAIPGDPDATLLLMPAWQGGRAIVVKILNIVPGNSARGLPAVDASVLVFDGQTGVLRAVLDGGEVTARRTAATSAMVADTLARRDAEELLIVGAGRIAANLAAAHASVRRYRRVRIWARRESAAATLARQLSELAPVVKSAPKLEQAVREADVIACATLAREPLVHGEWLRPGAHLDLVGGYTPQMREADDVAIARAGVIYVDTFDGALAEAGDIVQPLASGAITRARIAGELRDLCRGTGPGRDDDAVITAFKSVGTALEDYAAATLVVEQ